MTAEEIRKALTEYQGRQLASAKENPEMNLAMTPQIQATATFKLACAAYEIAAQLAELNETLKAIKPTINVYNNAGEGEE